MSIDLDWNALTTGPDGARFSESIRSFLDAKFQQITLPRFVRSVRVESFAFGSIPPDLEIIDICDPFSEFYDSDESDDDNNSDGSEDPDISKRNMGQESGESRQAGRVPAHLTPPGRFPDVDPPPFSHYQNNTSNNPAAAGALPRSNSGAGQPEFSFPAVFAQMQSPNRHFRPFNHPLSGTATPFAAASGFPGPYFTGDPSSRLDGQQPASFDSRPPSAAQTGTENDFQVMCRVRYSGDIRITVTAELLLDFALAGSVGIPVRLNVTGLTFDGVAVVARVRDGKKVHACFVQPDESDKSPLSPDQFGSRPAPTTSGLPRPPSPGILSSIQVESEIGADVKDGKQTLRNVGRVERFVLEQVQRVLETELVFPSYWTFLV